MKVLHTTTVVFLVIWSQICFVCMWNIFESENMIFSGVRVTRSLVLYVCFVYRFCLFVLFLLVIVLPVLLYTNYDYPFGIFKTLLSVDRHQPTQNHYRCSYQEGGGIPLSSFVSVLSQNVIYRDLFCVQWVQLRWEPLVLLILVELMIYHCLS